MAEMPTPLAGSAVDVLAAARFKIIPYDAAPGSIHFERAGDPVVLKSDAALLYNAHTVFAGKAVRAIIELAVQEKCAADAVAHGKVQEIVAVFCSAEELFRQAAGVRVCFQGKTGVPNSCSMLAFKGMLCISM